FSYFFSASLFCSYFPYHISRTPYLHSFPTRRSSDLLFPCSDHSKSRRLDSAAGKLGIIFTGKRSGCIDPYQPVSFSSGYGGIVQDRKSTRLNSSHVSISYAVFCLKKKIRILIVIVIH